MSLNIRRILTGFPVLGSVFQWLKKNCTRWEGRKFDTRSFWDERYLLGGDSGAGSYGRLARFKAKVINQFVIDHSIQSVIEHGCGDGAQLKHSSYPEYLGFDVSPKALELCRKLYERDETKSFRHSDEYKGEKADLALSLDVVYHLVEESEYEAYMYRLFGSSVSFVGVYSSNSENIGDASPSHVRHRKFTDWIEKNRTDWSLIQETKNQYPLQTDYENESFANFYFFEKYAEKVLS